MGFSFPFTKKAMPNQKVALFMGRVEGDSSIFQKAECENLVTFLDFCFA
jgi:hypothetical protein